MGNYVYVDWIVDAQLDRTNVTKDTCQGIKERMNQCRSLFYATSKAASNSKWMPWELGYMDGKTTKCAILPIMKETHQTTYKGQEYLSVYPYVQKKKLARYGDEGELYIIKEDKPPILFDEWLKTSKLKTPS